MPIEKFPYTNEHPNFEAHKWIDALLDSGLPPDTFGLCKPQVKKAAALDKNLQISVLRACVERMPWYRVQSTAAWVCCGQELAADTL